MAALTRWYAIERSTSSGGKACGNYRRRSIDNCEIAQYFRRSADAGNLPRRTGRESLDVIEIVFALEEKFDITIPLKADEATRLTTADKSGSGQDMPFSTVGDVAEIVQKLIAAKTAKAAQ